MLAPADVARLEINTTDLRAGPVTRGVAGSTRTLRIPATITLDTHRHDMDLVILTPDGPNHLQDVNIPSLLGRDILSGYALFFEPRTGTVLLLDPNEADAFMGNLPDESPT